jgi:hypothetical protein
MSLTNSHEKCAEGSALHDSEHHVKFKLEEEEAKNHHENLEIHKIDEHSYHINLGYLKIDHYYKVTFSLNIEGGELTYKKDKSSKHVTLKEMKNVENGQRQFVFVFYAFKDKIDQEQVVFSRGSHDHITLNFEAKVLGKNQGTPLLRNGITLLHHVSEQSHFNFI